MSSRAGRRQSPAGGLAPLAKAPTVGRMPSPSRAALTHGMVIAAVVLLTGLQPVSTDLYLPGLPTLRSDFGVSASAVQMAHSLYVLCFGFSQLAWGPASDRFGRRPTLGLGLAMYVGAGVVSLLAGSMPVFTIARAVQGVGLAACMVCVRALVRDLYEPHEGTRVTAAAMSIFCVIAIGAPLVGGAVASAWGWRGALGVTALYGCATMLFIVTRFPETARRLNPQATRLAPLLRTYAGIVRHPGFVAWTALMAFGYGAYFAFYAASSFTYVGQFGVSRNAYGLVLAGGSIAYLAGTLLCRRWLAAHGVRGTVARATVFSTLSVLMFVVPVFHGGHTFWTLSIALWLHLMGYGAQQPCAQVGMAGPFPLEAGAATALGGCILAVGAALSGMWLGSSFDGTANSIALIVAVLVAGCGITALTLVQRYGAATPVLPVASSPP